MKKSLLFVALFATVMSANAQTEICFVDKEKGGFPESGKASMEGGTEVAWSDNVTMKLAYTDDWGVSSLTTNGYRGAIVNGEAVTFTGGAVGNTNPAGNDLTAPAAANGGAVFQFDVKKDGYLTVFGKLSSNKPYVVFEGLAGMGELPVAYSLAMDFTGANVAETPVIYYTIPGDDMGYTDFAAADIANYVDGTNYRWPERIATGDFESALAKNGVGAIMFPVYAEAGSYLVYATGSKATICGAVFTTEPVTSLSLTGADEDGNAISLALIGEADPAGIQKVQTAAQNGAIYNVAGQKVDENYKGLVIKNGKKVIQ